VAHSAGGGQRVVQEGEVVEEKTGGGFGAEDGLGDSVEGLRGGRGT
jgi:hypothetical protein